MEAECKHHCAAGARRRYVHLSGEIPRIATFERGLAARRAHVARARSERSSAQLIHEIVSGRIPMVRHRNPGTYQTRRRWLEKGDQNVNSREQQSRPFSRELGKEISSDWHRCHRGYFCRYREAKAESRHDHNASWPEIVRDKRLTGTT